MRGSKVTPFLSVVTTLYRSEEYVEPFWTRTVAVATALTDSFEVIFVDDGSPDGSAAAVRKIVDRDSRAVLVELSRNFGHHNAIMAGLSQSRGECVFLLDSDLEEEPEWLLPFYAELQATGADVVYGIQSAQPPSFLRGLAGAAYYKLFNSMANVQVPEGACTVRLMRRPFVDALMSVGDRSLWLGAAFAWVGFRQIARPVERHRKRTRSTYNLWRSLHVFADAAAWMSRMPLVLAFFAGAFISGGAFLVGLYFLLRKLLSSEPILVGFPSLIISIWFLGGLIILFLGVIGIYLSSIFAEVKRRPLYVVQTVLRSQGADDE
jgi:putative glycosyltransferase